MSLTATTEAVRARLGETSGLDATLKFDCGSEGVIHVDATRAPAAVTNEDKPAACTIRITREDLQALLDGSLNPTSAFMSGRIGVDGDMSVAMRLAQAV